MVEIENPMVVDSLWEDNDSNCENLPTCGCCMENIRQYRALHILSGKKKIWICDRCIEDMKELIGH